MYSYAACFISTYNEKYETEDVNFIGILNCKTLQQPRVSNNFLFMLDYIYYLTVMLSFL